MTPIAETGEALAADLLLGLEVTVGSDVANLVLSRSSDITSYDTDNNRLSDDETESTNLDFGVEPDLDISSDDLPPGQSVIVGR